MYVERYNDGGVIIKLVASLPGIEFVEEKNKENQRIASALYPMIHIYTNYPSDFDYNFLPVF